MQQNVLRRWLVAVAVSSLTVGSALPAAAQPAVGGGPRGEIKAVSAVTPGGARVSQDLQQALTTSGGPIRFLVKLRSQANVDAAVQEALQGRAIQAGRNRFTARAAGVAALRDTALRSQPAVESLLQDLRRRGQVQEYRSFWIVNGFAVTGTRAAVEALARHPQVELVDLDRDVWIIPSQPVPDLKARGGSGRSPGQMPVGKPTAPAPGSGGAGPRGPGLTNGPMGGNPGIQEVEWGIDRIGAPGAWALGVDGTGAVVGSIDTGVEWTHPALQSRFRGYDPGNPGSPVLEGNWFDAVNGQSTPYDDNGHGTHVTGTMVGSDGENQIGVAPGARWIAAKAFSGAGQGQESWLLAAAQWMTAPTDASGTPHPEWAPDVVNNSWGGGPGLDEWFRPIVQTWRSVGIFPAFANGNAGPGEGTVSAPGNYPESFAVGATDQNDMVANFSSRGPSPYGEIKPEIAAPGVGIRSSIPGGGYGAASGTSMATPHVAGTVALLVSANANLTVDEMEQILLETAVPRTDSQYPDSPNNGYGHGLLSAFDAVAAVISGRGTLAGRVTREGTDATPPTVSHQPVAETYAGLPLAVTAEVADDYGVAEATLYARTAGAPEYQAYPMRQLDGDHLQGTWGAVIPGQVVQIPAVEYYIAATDGAGNTGNSGSAGSPHTVVVNPGIQPGYSEDFENEPAGWNHGGNNDPWQWGAPTSGPGAAHSGTNVMATVLDGNYDNNTNAWLMMPPIDLTQTSSAVLSWWQWYDIENGWDFADVYASTNGTDWDQLASFTGNGRSWQQQQVDLSAYAGQSLLVIFNFYSDGSVVRPGWYIDDVTLIGPDSEPPAPPADLTAEPDSIGNVVLSWTPPADADLDGYKIYRSDISGQDYAEIAQIGAPASGYTDSTAPGGQPAYYVVTALDRWGNESTYSNEASAIPEVPGTLFFDDMEHGENGWTHGGTQDTWALGVPTSGPGSAHSGANAWGTNLSGNYPNGSNAWLMSPAVELTGGSAYTLQFAHWYSFEANWDYGYVEVSADGTNWQALVQLTGSGESWQQPAYDLSDYAGQTVQIRFRMTSDGSVTRPGWFIDDVRVLSVSGGAAAPGKLPRLQKRPQTKTKLMKPLLKTQGAGANLPGGWRLLPDGRYLPTDDQGHIQAGTPRVQDSRNLAGGSRKAGPTGGTDGTGGIGLAPVSGAARSVRGVLELPVDATVTILETGRSVRTDPATGEYQMGHAAGEYTARAEAYGFYPMDVAVTIADGQTTTANFLLQPIPTGTVQGQVVDATTGAPVAGARLWLAEDVRVAPVETDANGMFSLTAYAGDYTLNVSHGSYYPQSLAVTIPGDGSTEVLIELQPFVGAPGELAYDDGSAENAWAYFEGGNGWAVRFSPAAGEAVRVRGARFRFWDTSWPNPGGTDFAVEVWDASGPDGAPGQRVGGPVAATANRDGSWTDVDLTDLGLIIQGDFYIAYIQVGSYPNVPGLATDEDGDFAGRSWALVGGAWNPTPEAEGNRMIRALVDVEVPPPTITSPADGTVVSSPGIDVSGSTAAGATVTLYRNGNAAGSGTAGNDGSFTIPVTLEPGENVLTATATVGGGTTAPSAPVRVYLDSAPPTLVVTEPEDGLRTGREVVTIAGQATDDLALAGVTINGEPVALGPDGCFSERRILDPGENLFTIVATDEAGNATTVTRTVIQDGSGGEPGPAPEIRNPEPTEDVTLAYGQSVTIRFESDPGLQAAYAITLPGPNTQMLVGSPMEEVSPGVYEATYTATYGNSFQNAGIYLQVETPDGRKGEAMAPGRLTVVDNELPRPWIKPPTGMLRVGQNLRFEGDGSYDPDGVIVSYEWDMGDGTRRSGENVRHRYTAPGTYTVTLTVTDDEGYSASISVQVRIRP